MIWVYGTGQNVCLRCPVTHISALTPLPPVSRYDDVDDVLTIP